MFHNAISRKKNRKVLCSKVLGFAVALFLGHVSLLAGSYTVPLNLTEHTSQQGDYLAADFNFEMAFSHIEQVSVEFVMPNGYEGSHSTTGNSSYIRNLMVSVHEQVEKPLDLALDPYTNPTASFKYIFSINPNYLATTHFLPPYIFESNPELNISDLYDNQFNQIVLKPRKYPEYLLAGYGGVSFTDEFRSSFHPLPSGHTVHSSTIYSLPGEISSATLTIVGTPVPEPGSFVLIVLAMSGAAIFGWQRAIRKQA